MAVGSARHHSSIVASGSRHRHRTCRSGNSDNSAGSYRLLFRLPHMHRRCRNDSHARHIRIGNSRICAVARHCESSGCSSRIYWLDCRSCGSQLADGIACRHHMVALCHHRCGLRLFLRLHLETAPRTVCAHRCGQSVYRRARLLPWLAPIPHRHGATPERPLGDAQCRRRKATHRATGDRRVGMPRLYERVRTRPAVGNNPMGNGYEPRQASFLVFPQRILMRHADRPGAGTGFDRTQPIQQP